MELWPGYQTSIRQHESDILLCTEVAHKVMRTDTLYNILSEAIRDNDDYQTAFKRENNIRSLDTVIKKKQFKFNAQVIQIPGLSK